MRRVGFLLGFASLLAACGFDTTDANGKAPETPSESAQLLDTSRGFTFFLSSDVHYDQPSPEVNSVVDDMNSLEGKAYTDDSGETVATPWGVLIAGDLVQANDSGSGSAAYGFWGVPGCESSGRCSIVGLNFVSRFGGGYQDAEVAGPNYNVNVPGDWNSAHYQIYEGFGNHDVAGSPNVDIPAQIVARNDRQRNPASTANGYGKSQIRTVNPNYNSYGYYSWDWQGIHFVNLNTFAGTAASARAQGMRATTGYNWLLNDLLTYVGNSGKPVIVMQHFEYESVNDGPGGIEWNRADRLRFKDLLAPYNVPLILAGHAHQADVYTVDALTKLPTDGSLPPAVYAYRDEMPESAVVVRPGSTNGDKNFAYRNGSYVVARVNNNQIRFNLRGKVNDNDSYQWRDTWNLSSGSSGYPAVPNGPTTLDLTSREYTRWNTGEPNGGPAENCVEMNAAFGWAYNDLDCSVAERFACRDTNAGTWSLSPSSSRWRDPDYDPSPVCPAGTVFDNPKSEADRAALETVASAAGVGRVWIRLTDQGVEGRFERSSHPRDHRPIYATWLPGEPDDYQSDEDCAVMDASGRYSDITCRNSYRLACRSDTDPSQWALSAERHPLDMGIYPVDPTMPESMHNPRYDWPNPLLDHVNPCPAGSTFSAPRNLGERQALQAAMAGQAGEPVFVRLSDAKREGVWEYSVLDRDQSGSPIVSSDGMRCITIAGDNAVPPLEARPCDSSASQQWVYLPDGRLKGSSGFCVAYASSAGLYLTNCGDAATDQTRWLPTWGGGLQNGGSGLCIESAASPGTAVGAATCQDTAQQRWSLSRARRWTVQAEFGVNTLDTETTPSLSHSFGLADVDGDGYPDACGRYADGVHCGKHTTSDYFAAPTLFSDGYGDSSGWGIPQYGSTMQYPDVNHDGRADVCARGYWGIVCAHSTGSGFTNPYVWTADFSDAQGWAGSAAQYLSIRFADVDGDGWIDVCGRKDDGIWCGLNNRAGHFAPATRWYSGDFTDLAGWGNPQYGTTIQLGDINGDGKADLCGRSGAGLRCVLSTGSSFYSASGWAPVWTTDFSDAAAWNTPGYYSSIRLVDVDGDGRADACGRSIIGVVCGLSTGAGFQPALPYTPGDFTDAAGWNREDWAGSLTFADLDQDGHPEVCGRCDNGVYCTLPVRHPVRGNGAALGAASYDRNDLEVFLRGASNELWRLAWNGDRWFVRGGSLGGTLASDPACVTRPAVRVIDCFAQGTNNGLITINTTTSGSTWAPVTIADGLVTSQPSATSWASNRIDVFAFNAWGQLSDTSWGGFWNGLSNLGSPSSAPVSGAPACTTRLGTQIDDCVVSDANSRLWQITIPNGGASSAWLDVFASAGIQAEAASSPTMLSQGASELDLFYRGVGGDLRHLQWFGGAWIGPELLGSPPGGLTGDPTCVLRPGSNVVDCVAFGKNHVVYQRTWTGLIWTDWGAIAE